MLKPRPTRKMTGAEVVHTQRGIWALPWPIFHPSHDKGLLDQLTGSSIPILLICTFDPCTCCPCLPAADERMTWSSGGGRADVFLQTRHGIYRLLPRFIVSNSQGFFSSSFQDKPNTSYLQSSSSRSSNPTILIPLPPVFLCSASPPHSEMRIWLSA